MEEQSLFVNLPRYTSGTTFTNTKAVPFTLPMHRHEANSEILYIEEGEGRFNIDGVDYYAGPGTLLFYQRGVWHEENSVKYPFCATYMSFDQLQLRGLPPLHFLPAGHKPAISLQEHGGEIVQMIRACNQFADSSLPESQLLANSMAAVLFISLARIIHYREQREADSKQVLNPVLRARTYMEQNFRDEITLEMLAARTYINKYYLSHLFKEEMGMSPIQFLIACRIDAAKRYLQTTSLPSGSIAELVGYRSEPSFYKAFRKMAGLTPAEFREQFRE